MVVAVDALQRLRCHIEIAGGFPKRNAALHPPRCAGVSQHVRRDVLQTGFGAGGRQPALDVAQPLAVLMDDETEVRPTSPRSPEMAEQLSRDQLSSRPLVRSPRTRRVEVDPAICRAR